MYFPSFSMDKSAHFILVKFVLLATIANSGTSTSSRRHHSSSPSIHPHFLPSQTQVLVQQGQNAFFQCKIQNLRNETVVWIRNNDSMILFVGTSKFADDSRFHLLRDSSNGIEDWTMRLQYPRLEDQGGYECQISTSPKRSQFFQLHIVVPQAKIHGDTELYVESGSPVTMRCVVSQWLRRPHIIWYHNSDKILNGKDGFISKQEEFIGSGSSSITSYVKIENVDSRYHSGTYMCAPNNIKSASLSLHVVKDENAAAMHETVSSHGTNSQYTIWTITISMALTKIFQQTFLLNNK